MQTKCYASLDFYFWCKCLLMGMSWCKCPCRYAMMQISLEYAMNANFSSRVCHDANASCGYVMNANACLGMQWMQMSPWEYVMMRMSAWEYAMAWMSSCRYAMNANASLWVYHDMECFGANTIYSKIPFIFKTRLPQRLKPKYFQTQFIIPKKSSSFWLKAP